MHMVCLIWKFSRGQVLKGNIFTKQQKMRHELQTSYLSIKNAHFKQFWILISQYNKTLRAPWEIMQKEKMNQNQN